MASKIYEELENEKKKKVIEDVKNKTSRSLAHL